MDMDIHTKNITFRYRTIRHYNQKVGTRRLLHDNKTGQQWDRTIGAGKPWQDGHAGQPGEGS